MCISSFTFQQKGLLQEIDLKKKIVSQIIPQVTVKLQFMQLKTLFILAFDQR